jgi:hypothetical protein
MIPASLPPPVYRRTSPLGGGADPPLAAIFTVSNQVTWNWRCNSAVWVTVCLTVPEKCSRRRAEIALI